MSTPSESSPFKIEHEGQPGTLRVVLVLDCPKCGETSRFYASDEAAEDGSFNCTCGLRIAMTQSRLSVTQASLDVVNKSVKDLGETFDRLNRRRR